MTIATRVRTTLSRRLGAALLATLLIATAAPVYATPSSDSTASVEPVGPPAPTRTPPSAVDALPVEVEVDEETLRFREELARRQAMLDEFMAQLDALDRELAIATEQYNAAVERLNTTKQRVDVAETDLAKAAEAYEQQNDLLGQRATSIYKNGSLASIELVLQAKSLSDLVSRVKFLNTLGIADAEVAKSLRGQKELVEQTAERLQNAATEAEALEFELRARQIEIMLRIQERQEMLADAEAELLELLDEEASRRQSEENELLRQILGGASSAGIVIEPGSPIETALAYHGIPYLWGGSTPSGFDCSGLVLYVFRQHGVNLPHYSRSQFLLGERVVPAALQPGDVVFFGSPVYHVGIYMGADYFIHAPRTGDFVRIQRLSDRRDYAGARRYDWQPRVGSPQGVTQPQPVLPSE